MRKYKIGIYGSAVDEGKKAESLAKSLGIELAKRKEITLITGAGHGIPYLVAQTAASLGTYVWGFPPVRNEKDLKKYMPGVDMTTYKKITYIPNFFPLRASVAACRVYRNFASTKEADAGIIISGRWGTMNEFTNLHSMGKTIGILEGTGGIADELSSLLVKIEKPTDSKIVIEKNPEKLVEKILLELDKIKS